MQSISFYTPYFGSKLQSTGKVIEEKGEYLQVEVTAGFMQGTTTFVHKNNINKNN